MGDVVKMSIMIPTYNRAHYLGDAIESALAQRYSDFEVIVSDNGSGDDTGNVVKRYLADPRLRYYRNERNLGAGANWQKLLYEYARGDYGKFLPDDDYLVDSNHLRKAAAIIKTYGVKIVFSAPVSQYEDERRGRAISLELSEVVPRQWWVDHVCKVRFGVTYFPSCCSGQVFELAHARETDSFKGEIFADYAYALRLILSEERTGYIRDPSYLERRHPGQDGRSSFQNAASGMRIFDGLYEYGVKLETVDRGTLDRIRLRGYKFFARAFLMPNWISENGRRGASLFRFMEELNRFDSRLPVAVLSDINVLTQFILYDSWAYKVLKQGYRSARSSRLAKYLRQKWVARTLRSKSHLSEAG